MDCTARTGPHECKRTWICSHGETFTAHTPAGGPVFASDTCAGCKAECEAEQPKLDRVAAQIGDSLWTKN